MAKRYAEKQKESTYPLVTKKGQQYYRTRIKDADGKRVDIYGKTEEELEKKIIQAEKKIEETRLRIMNPTVEEYSLKWLKMHSANISPI